MFLTAASAFEIFAAIQIGEKALSFAQSIPMLSLLFGSHKNLNSNHNQIYQSFITHLKNIYQIDDDNKLPIFVRPEGDIKSQTITIQNWFTKELLDENLMLTNQGKYGQKILLIDANVINRKILKIYDLIDDKSSFTNVLLGYLYYFTNYELVLMTGHQKEIEHVDKVINLIRLMIGNSKIIELCLSDTEGRLDENFQDVLNTLTQTIKPKLTKQIARRTVKEKLDHTAQNFHLVTYALLNTILLITEGNVNFHLSMDPEMIKNDLLQTGSKSSWSTKNQTHSLNPNNPLKIFLIKAYAALHEISQDTRSYGKLEIMLPNIFEIKKFLNSHSNQVDNTFTFSSLSSKGSDSRELISIYNDSNLFNERTTLIFNLTSFALSLINSSYVIENILDLLAINNNCWIFNPSETQSLQKYFHNIEQKILEQLKDINKFTNNYKKVKVLKNESLTSSNEIIKYLDVVSESLNNNINPEKDIESLSQNKLVTNHQLNHIKRETLLILNANLNEKDKKISTNDELDKYETELAETLYFCIKIGYQHNLEKIMEENFKLPLKMELQEKHGNDFESNLSSFYRKAYNLCYSIIESDLVITDTEKKLHDNYHINILLNLIDLAKKLQNHGSVKVNSHSYLSCHVHINYLGHLKNRFLGLLIRKERLGEVLTENIPDDLEDIHYSDYLALKEKQTETKLAIMQESLNESSIENAKLHQVIKDHIHELRRVNDKNKEIQKYIETITQSLKNSEAKVQEYIKTQVSLEGHIDKLLDTQLQNIEDCHSEVLTLDALSETLRKMLSIRAASEETEVILVIYDVISKFKERMKFKCEALSSNANQILDSFEQLKSTNKIITDTLKKRTEQVLSSYKDISIRISEIVKKLEVQSEMLSTITANLEKAKKEKAIKIQKEKEEAEKKQQEKIQRKSEARQKSLEEQKLKAEIKEKELEKEKQDALLLKNSKREQEVSYDKNLKPFLINNLQMYSAFASNQWFYYFRMSYRQNKCAKLFKNILNDDSLIFQHKLIILNTLIEKILNNTNLQKLDADEFHDVIDNIQDSSSDIFDNADYDELNDHRIFHQRLFKYNEDLENDVDSSVFYDLCFGKGVHH